MLTKAVNAAGIAVIAAGALVLLASPAAAESDGWVGVDPDSDSVEVGAGTEEDIPGAPDDGGSAGAGAGTDDDGGESSVPAGMCPNYEYELVDSDSGTYKGASAGERPSEEHMLMGRWCRNPHTGTTQVGAEWVLVDEDGNPTLDPRVLAQQAVDSLQLPKPQIAASPEASQLVRLPVWLWLEGTSWESQSASASVPGLTVTAEAVPAVATWDMGDGTTIECDGPGTVWTKAAGAEAESPDCGHVYEQPSAEELPVSVVITWEVSWSGGGESGTVPDMTTEATEAWPVTESHALVTR
jgi:hypothetical protein